ncbi:acyl carrier protein [Hydrogenophaga sp. PBL-H3]|uniref:acyl carrier protein n=1 Tax=Hydrogenophaga sp. PBL-H3 TaxID=434010 RepID=UPI00131FA453|nr:acyl carrier protein [Hydrogenophaga sp. PBL-H3]QHE76159.1 acyl carrier protein [Hydrogenophaga sp. PBL-H3]QHE80583.1 acyl carrier protein [Hydrogenophaga sp. PBL-H3]
MNSPEALRQAVAGALRGIAPEADIDRIDPAASLREQLDLDSFDFLKLLITLQETVGVDIPEADYGRVDSLNALVAYLRGV